MKLTEAQLKLEGLDRKIDRLYGLVSNKATQELETLNFVNDKLNDSMLEKNSLIFSIDKAKINNKFNNNLSIREAELLSKYMKDLAGFNISNICNMCDEGVVDGSVVKQRLLDYLNLLDSASDIDVRVALLCSVIEVD
jgi:hypothetical protein